MGIEDAKHIIVQTKYGLDIKVNLTDLHIVDKDIYTKQNFHNAFLKYRGKVRFIPDSIKIGIPPNTTPT